MAAHWGRQESSVSCGPSWNSGCLARSAAFKALSVRWREQGLCMLLPSGGPAAGSPGAPHPARVCCSLWQSWTLLEPWSLFVLSAGSLHAVPLTCPNILTNANCFFLYFVLTQEPQTTVIHNPDGNKVLRKNAQHRLALTRVHISPHSQSKINCLKLGKKSLSLF